MNITASYAQDWGKGLGFGKRISELVVGLINW